MFISGGSSGGSSGGLTQMTFKNILTGDNKKTTQNAGTTKKYYIGVGVGGGSNAGSVTAMSASPIIINGYSFSVQTAMYGTPLPINIIAEITAQSDITFETINTGYLIEIE